jgi:multidrug efflux system outer membrane protein
VAQGYFRLRTLDWQLQLSEKALAMRQATLSLFQDRLKGGVGSDVEVARAEANVRDVEAQMATLRQAIVQAENALAFFSAKPPAATARGKVGIEALALPPQVPAGLPSALLTRRPDVRSAERELAAANARVGVVTAEYFPKFDLTGSLGFLTNDLARITTSGATDLVWRSAGQMSWMAPIFGGATLNAKMAAAKAAWEGAKAAYERAALNSFREVSDALIAIGELDNAHRARVAQVAALDRAVVSAETRFRGGVANHLEVVQAQELQLVAQLALAGVRGSQFSALVDLYRALGGGWTPPKES